MGKKQAKYIIDILENCDVYNVEQVNDYVDNLEIHQNSKRMKIYYLEKWYLQYGSIPTGLKKYKQVFTNKVNFLSWEQVKMLESNFQNDFQKFIFKFLIESGIRLQEFTSINWYEFNSTSFQVINAKQRNNEKEFRWAFVQDSTLKLFRNLTDKDKNRLNLRRAIQYELSELGKISDLEIPLSPHVLRRTKGSITRINGGKLEDIADILGHKSIEITRKYYTKFNPEYLKQISNLSSLKPSEAFELNSLKKEIEFLKKENIYLKQLLNKKEEE